MLEAADLECERGGKILFQNLSLRVAQGNLLRIAGPNGSGKTSLLRILCGLLTPSGGEVRWQGQPIRALREEFSRCLVFLGHAPAVKGDLTAAENLAIACRLSGLPTTQDRLKGALQRFGLPAETIPVRRLSQGQRRRAALARLGVSAAVPLWLLDEPFSALDEQGIELLKEMFAQQRSRGGAIVFTTHQDPGIAATQVVELG